MPVIPRNGAQRPAREGAPHSRDWLEGLDAEFDGSVGAKIRFGAGRGAVVGGDARVQIGFAQWAGARGGLPDHLGDEGRGVLHPFGVGGGDVQAELTRHRAAAALRPVIRGTARLRAAALGDLAQILAPPAQARAGTSAILDGAQGDAAARFTLELF